MSVIIYAEAVRVYCVSSKIPEREARPMLIIGEAMDRDPSLRTPVVLGVRGPSEIAEIMDGSFNPRGEALYDWRLHVLPGARTIWKKLSPDARLALYWSARRNAVDDYDDD